MRWRHFAGLSHHLALPGRVRHQCAHTHTHTHTGGQGRKQAKISNYRKCHTHTHSSVVLEIYLNAENYSEINILCKHTHTHTHSSVVLEIYLNKQNVENVKNKTKWF